MTKKEVDRRILELDLERARLLAQQASNHYERSRRLHASHSGAITPEELEDSRTARDLALVEVQMCEVRLEQDDMTQKANDEEQK